MTQRHAKAAGLLGRVAWHAACLFLTAMCLMWAIAPHSATAQEDSGTDAAGDAAMLPPRRDVERRVYDNAALLTEDQEEGFENDLERACTLGFEIVVYTRISMESADESQAFAERILTEWNVETEAGAGDGLVYLLTYDPSNLENNSIVAAIGDNVLPIRQLDDATFQGILEDEMRPALAEGEADIALMYGVRRLLNYAEYSPPDPAPLSDTQRVMNRVGTTAGAILIQLAVLGYFVTPVIREHALTLLPSTGSLARYGLVLAILAIGTGAIAITGRSGIGSLCALGSFGWATCGVPLLAARSRRMRSGDETIRVSPRRRLPARWQRRSPAVTSTVVARG